MSANIREALVLAAGKGSRMNTPGGVKALRIINSRPLICYAIEALIEYGVRIIWIVKYYSDSFAIVNEIYSNFDVEIKYIDDYERKGSLYSFSLARRYIKNDFICMDCDLFVEKKAFSNMIDIGVRMIKQEKVIGVIAYVSQPSKEDANMLLINNNRVIRFVKKGELFCKRGGYVYLWRKSIFDYISLYFKIGCYSFSKYIDYIVQNFEVGMMEIDDMWDIDNEDDVEYTCRRLDERAFW